jgi:hypothetical protein
MFYTPGAGYSLLLVGEPPTSKYSEVNDLKIEDSESVNRDAKVRGSSRLHPCAVLDALLVILSVTVL